MFSNIGQKIMALAKSITWIGIAFSLITGVAFFLYGEDEAYLGLIVIFIGPVLSWLSSLTLYGFGRLIETNEMIAEALLKKEPENTTSPALGRDPSLEKWYAELLRTESERREAKKSSDEEK